MEKTVGMVSLGCSKNTVDSEIMLGALRDAGWLAVSDPAKASALIVNTCGFIESAKQESIEAILEMAEFRKSGSCRALLVTGCLSKRYGEELEKELPEVDIFYGISGYENIAATLEEALAGGRGLRMQEGSRFPDIERVLTTPEKTAYLKISDGCDNRCAYCAIPLIRGGYRSRPYADIIREARELREKGIEEVLLIAQDTTRYGTDGQQASEPTGSGQLPSLLADIADMGFTWVRPLYLYPHRVDAALLDVMEARENIPSYLDIPIQHFNDDILRAMNRHGNGEQLRSLVREAKKRGFTLRTTVIVGFPGETEERFEELLDFLEEAAFDRLGAFTYSPEEDTPAAAMETQLSEEVKEERYARLMALQQGIAERSAEARVGSIERMLIEGQREDGLYMGRTRLEAPDIDGQALLFSEEALQPGDFVTMRVTGALDYDIVGEML